jgi:hypothetical protein
VVCDIGWFTNPIFIIHCPLSSEVSLKFTMFHESILLVSKWLDSQHSISNVTAESVNTNVSNHLETVISVKYTSDLFMLSHELWWNCVKCVFCYYMNILCATGDLNWSCHEFGSIILNCRDQWEYNEVTILYCVSNENKFY